MKIAYLLMDKTLALHKGSFDRVLDALEQEVGPFVEEAELGCAYVGLDGFAELYGGEGNLMRAILGTIPADFEPRLGVAHGKFPAHLAANTVEVGQALYIPDARAFVAPLSIDWLPVSKKTIIRFHGFGLYSMGQIAALLPECVEAQFGAEGRRAWELTNGIDRTPLIPRRREETVIESLTFPAPTVTLEAILLAAEILLSRAFNQPSLQGRYARQVLLQAQLLQGELWQKRIPFKQPMGDVRRAMFAIKSVLSRVSLPGPLEELTLTLSGLTGERGRQKSLVWDVRRREDLLEAIRQLEARLGGKPPIYQVRDVEPWSRMPERRHTLVDYDL